MSQLVYDVSLALFGAAVSPIVFVGWTRYLAPIWRSRRFRVPKLDGTTWDGFSQKPMPELAADSRLELRQRGDLVTATIERRTSHGQRTFVYNGFIRGGQFVFTWEEPAGEGLVCGALVLKISGNLLELSGLSVYEDLDKAQVISEPRYYRRVE